MRQRLSQNGVMEFVQSQVVELAQPVVAKLQAQVGLFLADKQVLVDAQRRVTTPEQLERVQALYAQQLELEGQLGTVLPPLQAGQYDLATITSASLLYARIEAHHSAVDKLRRELGLAPATAGLDWTTVAFWGGAVIVGLGFFTGSRTVMVLGGAGVVVGGWTKYRATGSVF